MKKIFLLLLLFCSVSIWGQYLEIHHIGVGHGDSTLIIANDGKNTQTVLIDAGGRGKGIKVVWPYVSERLSQIKYKQLDYIIISHFHSDHFAGMKGFLDSLIKDEEWGAKNIGFIIDRCAKNIIIPKAEEDIETRDGNISAEYDRYDEYDFDSQLKSPTSKTYSSYVRFLSEKDLTSKRRPNCGDSNPNLLSGLKGFEMIPVAVSGYIIPGKKIIGDKPKNENDLSYAFIVKFGEFKYFTGGDLGGSGSSYTDMETPLSESWQVFELLTTPASECHVCACKISHHGSSHSTNGKFLSTFNPSLAVIPAALRKYGGKYLPTLELLARLDNKKIPLKLGTYMTDDDHGNLFAEAVSRRRTVRKALRKVIGYKDILIKVTDPNAREDKSLIFKVYIRKRSGKTPYLSIGKWSPKDFICAKDHAHYEEGM